ncbi:hypothetical protein N9766_06920, partial [Flavobacteriaceae bacterium]|nr:hypothetical protein [Flavobacteriaceae bacterium]
MVFTPSETKSSIKVTPRATNVPAVGVDNFCGFIIPDYTELAFATDSCISPVSIIQLPAPGTIVGIGNTQITLTASDGTNNTNCMFAINV